MRTPTLRQVLLVLASVTIVALILGPLALVWGALYTTGGAQFIVRHLPRQIGGVQLQITGLSGTVAHGLHVERVEIDQELVHLKFEDIDARVALAPLLLQTIRASYGSVGRATITVKRRVHPPTPSPPLFLPSWLLISAEEAHVQRAELSVYNGFKLTITDISAAAVIRHKSIRLFQAEGVLEGAHVSGIGELLAADPLGFNVKGHLDWVPPGQPAYVLNGAAHGDLNRLQVNARIESPFRSDVNGQLLDLTNHFHWVANAVVHRFELSAWGIAGPLGSITGNLAASGDAELFSAQGAVNPTGLRAGVFEVQFTGGFAHHVLSAKRMEARHLDSGARASATGTIGIVDHGPQLDLKGAWNEFRWPLVGRDVVVRSAAGTFALEGLMPYRVRLSGDARALDLPVMPVDLTGTLDKDGFAFERAEVDLYGGHTSASGNVTWSPRDTWSVSGRATSIDPAQLRADLPGSLNFDYSASGDGFDAKGTLTASFSSLSGKLRGAPASGAGTVTHAGKTWGFTNLRVGLGSANLALDGHIDDRLDLRFAASAQDLSLLSPGSRGQLKASGTLGGTFGDPSLIGVAHGVDIDYQGIKLKAFDADIDFEPDAAGKESKIDAQLHLLTYDERTLNAATLTLRGLPSDYTVRFSASAPGIAANAQAQGAYSAGVFKGQLTALALSGNESLHLALDRPVGLLASLDHVRLEWLCLVGAPGSVCADGEWTPASWSTTLMTNELPLATLTAGRTPEVQYLGSINALARLSGGPATPTLGSLRAELANAEIAHRLASKKIEHTRIGSGTFSVTLAPTTITTQSDLGGGEIGNLHGTFNAQRTTPEWQDMPVAGELHIQNADVALVSLYVPDIDRASGHFNADLHVSGTFGAPRLAGQVKVTDGELDVYQVNVALRAIALEARLSDGGLDFKGTAAAGTGSVSADGHLEWRDLLPYGKFHLQGTNLRVADIPEAQIDASPDLDFTITGRKIEVTGKVLVPYAKIAPKDITNAVRASEDEVIVGAEEQDPSKRFAVMSDIGLALGDHISIDTLGLSAKLGGGIQIRSGYDAITRAQGELNIESGKYMAYGRLLDIQGGKLYFGGPIDNPGIQVTAAKVFPDVTAYVNVRGTLLQPRLSFSSVPPLPQSQIVSLILAGGSLESAQNRGSNVAIGQGVAMLAQEYGSWVGIQEASLESDVTNDTSLVLGRYLSPRLYVSYGISLTENLNTFKLRYTLGDHWTIRAELGQAQGADLVYSISK
jgi:translocation and assembly module TamB